jgi:integrase
MRIARKSAYLGHPPTSSGTRIPISRLRAESGLRDGPTLRFSVMRSLRRFLEEAGLPVEVRLHDLCHTAGTLALRQGVPLHTVSRMLGHSDPAMTLRRYAHVLKDMEDKGGRAMDDLF